MFNDTPRSQNESQRDRPKFGCSSRERTRTSNEYRRLFNDTHRSPNESRRDCPKLAGGDNRRITVTHGNRPGRGGGMAFTTKTVHSANNLSVPISPVCPYFPYSLRRHAIEISHHTAEISVQPFAPRGGDEWRTTFRAEHDVIMQGEMCGWHGFGIPAPLPGRLAFLSMIRWLTPTG